MSNYMDAMAVCPYYIKEKGGDVLCEAAKIRCKDNAMRRELIYRRCADRYNECQFKIALDNFYERKNKEDEKKKTFN